MKLAFIRSNCSYSHLMVESGLLEALHQLKSEDPTFDFIEINVKNQDNGDIECYSPDYCFCLPIASQYRALKKYKHQKVIIYETEGLYETNVRKDEVSYCDIFATVEKNAIAYYQNHAKKVGATCKLYHMPLGFSPNIYKFQEVEDKYKSDVLICGVMFDRRRDVLELLYPIRNQVKIKVICPKDWQGKIVHRDGIEILDTQSPEEMGKYMSGAKINLCINRDYDPSNDSGLKSSTPGRVFQETACRRLVMIDDSRPEVKDYFEDGKEIVVFSKTDLKDKILYYLSHDQEREAIAHNGYVRTMKENQWIHRIKNLLKVI